MSLWIENKEALDNHSHQKCETKVNEESFGKLILTSDIARPRETNTEDGALRSEYYCYLRGSLPKCLPEDLSVNRKRFYVVKETKLQHNDWTRLYLELAVATTHLSNLKIVKVAIETTEDMERHNEGSLNAINALVYIRYKELRESRVGKDVDRIAIVRRTFNERNGCFTLEGWNQFIKS